MRLIANTDVEAFHPWPEDCYIQGGKKGLVVNRNSETPSYTTAFFEAFPTVPDTFIRGEGSTITEAEDHAWGKYLKVAGCPEHEFEARGYTNGAGFCKNCGMFATNIFTPTQLGLSCDTCGVPTFWSEVEGKFYCKEHKPRDEWDEVLESVETVTDEDIKTVLTALANYEPKDDGEK